jgi:hypothetical protein
VETSRQVRQSTLIYVVTVVTSRPREARHTYIPWKPQFIFCVMYHLCIRETYSVHWRPPAIWWRSMELQLGGMTLDRTDCTLLKCSISWYDLTVLSLGTSFLNHIFGFLWTVVHCECSCNSPLLLPFRYATSHHLRLSRMLNNPSIVELLRLHRITCTFHNNTPDEFWWFRFSGIWRCVIG